MSMTVGEVIAELQKFDKDLPVIVNVQGWISSVHTVEFSPGDVHEGGEWPDEVMIGQSE